MSTGFSDWVINELPQPIFAVLMFMILVLASMLGRYGRRLRAGRNGGQELESVQEGYVVSAVLGLLALLMGFTFSMAVDRYDMRRTLVTEEANAISSSYLLAQTFEEPHRSRISTILVPYVDNRLELARAHDHKRIVPLLKESEAMQITLWSAALEAVGGLRDDVSSNFLDNTREVIEVGDRRFAARQAHIPTRVHMVLLIYITISAAVMGFAFANSPQYITSGTLFVLVTLSMLLIIDLDRPTGGAIVEPQHAMENLQARLRIVTPASFETQSAPVPPAVSR